MGTWSRIGFFFFGISLGGYLASIQPRSKRPAIYRLAKMELFIALLALPAAFLPIWTDWVWPLIGTELLVSWVGTLIKLLLTIVVVVPPAIAMGWTLPLFIRSATECGANVAPTGIWIYTLNTLGGVFGLWFASTCLLYWLGAQSSMILTSCINATVGLALWRLPFFMGEQPISRDGIDPDSAALKPCSTTEIHLADGTPDQKSVSRWNLYLLSFFSGAVVLSLEVLLLRLISLVVPSSYHTTSALLANVILILAVGAGLISFFNNWSPTKKLAQNRLLIVAAFSGAAICIILCPILLYQSTDKLISIRYLQALNGRTIESVGQYWLLVLWLVASSGGLALLCSGLVFPTLLTMSSNVDPAGTRIGLLLAANGLGGLAGTELFNSVLITVFGIYNSFVVLAVLIMVAVFAMMVRSNLSLALTIGVLLAGVMYVGQQTIKQIPYLSPNAKGVKAQSEHFGKDGVWLVVEKKSGSTGILVNNQYYLGGSGATVVQRRQLVLPWILTPTAKSVCCLGLATGITASGLEVLDDPPPITAVEISGNVVKLARQYFKEESGSFFDNTNNTVVVEDARTFVAASKSQYDLIVGDLYRPYGTGEGRLYSVEHFRNVRRTLTDEGVFCQWLPAYQLNEDNWLSIAATFQQVFPETLVIYGDPSIRNPVIGLVGRKSDGRWDSERLDSAFNNVPVEILDLDPALKSAKFLVVGALKQEALEQVKINTLDNLYVEISAGNLWILKELRKNRTGSYDDEFLSGKHLVRFNETIEKLVDPVLPSKYFQQLKKRIEDQLPNAE